MSVDKGKGVYFIGLKEGEDINWKGLAEQIDRDKPKAITCPNGHKVAVKNGDKTVIKCHRCKHEVEV